MTTRTFRILFVCLGNSCRSQMAEGFAKSMGEGIWEAESAGLMPATIIAPLTRKVMGERGVELEDHFPKPLEWMKPETFDLIVNLTEYEMPEVGAPVRTRKVDDPIGAGEKVYRRVRDEIEKIVKELLEEARSRLAN